MKNNFYLVLLLFLFTSCAEVQTFVNQYPIGQEKTLSSSEVSNGLKEALRIGSINAANILATKDGFYKDKAVKILLPQEAQNISKNIQMIPGGKDLIEKVEIRLNRAAEDAVKESAPIFAAAIKEMTITDAFTILKGNDDAATKYLQDKTYNKLKDLFLPKVRSSLNKKLLANMSTNESWSLLTNKYNQVAGSFAGKIANLEPVNIKLENYVTEKTLHALFLKIAEEEKQIRKDPIKRINDILKRVFGTLDK
ncbi:DUF4197 domain-containing protein [Ancylomarina longa]|uniref:DUF4197 domain-containing protein n=1 Tax=Ancylomarina longa TaxID=2487017 RepID=A0A434AVU7_9BACT|nr:DUF4197 domain-containing protein [Ancylomarina longa]RUT78612.1 DUF4197 domain-containing protein [Ancylomarina longa]